MSQGYMQRSEGNRIGYKAPGLLAHVTSCSSKYIRQKINCLDFAFVIYIGFRDKVGIHQKCYVVEVYGLYNLRKENLSVPYKQVSIINH